MHPGQVASASQGRHTETSNHSQSLSHLKSVSSLQLTQMSCLWTVGGSCSTRKDHKEIGNETRTRNRVGHSSYETNMSHTVFIFQWPHEVLLKKHNIPNPLFQLTIIKYMRCKCLSLVPSQNFSSYLSLRSCAVKHVPVHIKTSEVAAPACPKLERTLLIGRGSRMISTINHVSVQTKERLRSGSGERSRSSTVVT